ncbi:MAG: GNAT family N-acetyltransferase [Pseudomonadales bacterium]|jgi:RimJ/RimL family protein N-acetyltransferase|nr:GNAT family N-acetyltransferase [Pseudomonadales bacterium]MDP6472770.1 GNAT family N-acetyltransferase [Pseudomonadales bacterium]MDP6827983.1 GNAT family N-acetyltransferase [Pseudomonadales bacterium]MDP6972882.1 GNAT family N-acetyltransferase [Pseudomonadales bacterium]|tara:strand:- start:986 stop:1576 length:591 start_codon:yes stop_codon:yes gene_type:complete
MNDRLSRYPRSAGLDEADVQLRLMQAGDEPGVAAFAAELPTHDLLFLRRDITVPKVLSAWIEELQAGTITSLVAMQGDEVVGCTAVVVDPRSWSPHVGELRVLLARSMREKGLGRVLIQESFALALSLGLEKLTAQMTADQQAAIAVFEGMGFRAEALLRDHVRDRQNVKHDIVILSHDVADFQAKLEQYGLNDAF